MTYSQLLQKLQRLGLGQVSRMTANGYDVVSIGSPAQVVFPFPFLHFDLILDNGHETEIDEEIIDALLRWAGKERNDLDPPQ